MRTQRARIRSVAYAVLICAVSLTACSDTAAPDPKPVAAHIEPVSGDGQKAPPGTAVDEPLRARVTDAANDPVSRIAVVFSVTSGGGWIAQDTVLSDGLGMATSGPWTLGDTGAQVVRARAGQAETSFNATLGVRPDAPDGPAEAPPDGPSGPITRCAALAFVREGTVLSTSCDGSPPVAVATEATRPAWSPDGSRIAFTRPTNNVLAKWQLCVARENGSEARCTTGDADGDVMGGPSWSPDGSRVAFSVFVHSCPGGQCGQYGGFYSSLYVLETSSMRVDTVSTPPLTSVSWSPDGSRIAFTAFGTGTFGQGALGTVNADGSQLQLLTQSLGTYSAQEVAWSPDGRSLALLLWDESACAWFCDTAIGIVNPDATGLRILATGWAPMGPYFSAPAWSPDGARIAYTASRDESCAYDGVACGTDVLVVAVEGGSSEVLIADGGLPSWRP